MEDETATILKQSLTDGFAMVHSSNLAIPTVHLIGTALDLDGLENEWKELFEASPSASPPLRWEWVREWWQVFGPIYGRRSGGLRIVTFRRAGRLIGILPLYQRGKARNLFGPRRLGFISTGLDEFEETCAEYLDLLYLPGEEGACVQALATTLVRNSGLRCDELVFSDLRSGSPLLELAESLRARCWRVDVGSPGVCHLFDMTGGFEAYLGRLSHENRRQARKMLREAEHEGLKFEVAGTAEDTSRFFQQMVELHRQRWLAVGKPGSFAPRHAEFHRSLAERLAPRGEAVVARLGQDAGPVAVVFGYRVHEKFYCFQQGVTQGVGRLRSPGTACWLLLMRHLADEGVTLFDHQTGVTTFKERFGTGTCPLADLHVSWPTPRWFASRAAHWAKRATRKATRMLPWRLPRSR